MYVGRAGENMAADGNDTERAAVKTYVPAYQKAEWQAHAEDLDMSQSEFVRSMVQAGRREFDLDPVEEEDSDANPRGQDLEGRVLGILRSEGPKPWDELLANLTADIEDRLDETLSDLQSENRIEYSGRDGGYRLTEGAE
jgi:hypothetical protein